MSGKHSRHASPVKWVSTDYPEAGLTGHLRPRRPARGPRAKASLSATHLNLASLPRRGMPARHRTSLRVRSERTRLVGTALRRRFDSPDGAFYTLRAGAWARPASDLCTRRLMSLGEMIPTNRPPSTTSVRPSLQPSGRPSRLLTGSAGLAIDTRSSGHATSLTSVVARASGATLFRAAMVKSPLSRPAAS